jgi:hypothetical protein
MIKSDCPHQQAFMKQLNELLCLEGMSEALRTDAYDDIIDEKYVNFINRWCPTFTYKGAHIVEEIE